MAKNRTLILFETHKIFGKYLYAMRDMLPEMLLEISKQDGATSRAARQLMHMCTALGCARFELDDEFKRDYPDRYDFKIYYPWRDEPPRHNIRAERKLKHLAKKIGEKHFKSKQET